MTPDPRSVEENIYKTVHTYEVVKLVLLTLVVGALAIGSLVIVRLLNEQHESLIILRCAVSQEVAAARHNARTPQESEVLGRVAYDLCVKHGGPRS